MAKAILVVKIVPTRSGRVTTPEFADERAGCVYLAVAFAPAFLAFFKFARS